MKELEEKGLVLIPKLHCRNEEELRKAAGIVKEYGVDMFGGSVENNGVLRYSGNRSSLAYLKKVGNELGLRVVGDVHEERGDYLSDAFHAYNSAGVVSILPRRIGGSNGETVALDDQVLDEISALSRINRKPIIVKLPDGFSQELVSSLKPLSSDLRLAVGYGDMTAHNISYLNSETGNPVYLDVNVNDVRGSMAMPVEKAMDLGIGGVMFNVPISGSGMRPLEDFMEGVGASRLGYK